MVSNLLSFRISINIPSYLSVLKDTKIEMWHHLKFMPFISGLVIGAIIFFGFKPDSRDKVVKWPNPENAGKITYRDRNGLCYKFESQIVDCGKVKDSLQALAIE